MSRSTLRDKAKLLLDVSNACQEMVEYCSELDREAYLSDPTMQHVTAHLAIIIGEAMRRLEKLDPSIADAVPQIRDIIDTRNRIVHAYDSINYRMLWDIAIADIPPLKVTIDQLLEDTANQRRALTEQER